jgi:hypothetical protein
MTETVEALFRSQGILARWKGLEGTERKNALTKDKPKRRRKLAGGKVGSAVDQNSEVDISEENKNESSDDNQTKEESKK